jgi:mono/diheme cytochrome c family protein
MSFAGEIYAEALDDPIPPGRRDYLRYCASCHGKGGKGDGPALPALRVAPTDLTKLSQRQGGFDKGAILAAIDGRREVAAHGSREMPVWGAIFESELREEGKRYPSYLSLLKGASLVEYLLEIQARE